ncbi:BHLH domain-containing protein [Mycena indigotica]|uniref:BHLH domain-containing protein n=1 Tax=Mycena indigotica TaxID=2126181 RepID=A0A8H6S5Q2_9AGAR|nr:BHLH domain-containing protein [Mycena indigotica]KAF7292823.1 BHLH domain-containing protein [Mycena indigotica]
MTSPSSPAASDHSSSNSVSTGPPQTPVIPGLPLETPLSAKAQPDSNNAGGVKRTSKPSRRANTAERRATHNAVERQRRETLNGRFLDLAGMLPNLSQIRRPSKSAIVNSSIAHINASRRHRLLAAQQLRLLKTESDALRHEVNEWRLRAGIPGVEEPRRADGFSVVLSGELEFEPSDMLDGSEEGDEEEFGAQYHQQSQQGYPDESDEYLHQQRLAQQQQVAQQPLTISIGQRTESPPHYATSSPMIASPTAPVFDPAMAYDHHARHLHHHQLMLAQQEENEKWASYHHQQQQFARHPQTQAW